MKRRSYQSLRSKLEQSGWVLSEERGRHRLFLHPKGQQITVTISELPGVEYVERTLPGRHLPRGES